MANNPQNLIIINATKLVFINRYIFFSVFLLWYFEIRNIGIKREPTPNTIIRNHPTIPKWACNDKYFTDSDGKIGYLKLNINNIPKIVVVSSQMVAVDINQAWILAFLFLKTLIKTLIRNKSNPMLMLMAPICVKIPN